MTKTEKFLLGVILWLPTPFIRAWVLAKLYLWFVVPTYHVQPVSPAAAYGLAGMLALATYVPSGEKETDYPLMIGAGYAIPLVLLGFGWMIQRWWL